MAVRIGHASYGESGGYDQAAGDQKNGNEVKISNWYLDSRGGWVVFRCNDVFKLNKIAEAAEMGCNNDHIGYDMGNRNDLFDKVQTNGFNMSKEALTEDTETDCSAFVRVCIAYAFGKDITGNFNTSIQSDKLLKTGFFTKYTSDIYCKSSDYLARGDILVTAEVPGHTVVVLDNGPKCEIASILTLTLTRLDVKMLDITKDTARLVAKIKKIKDNKEEKFEDSEKESLTKYTWSYVLKALDNNNFKEIRVKVDFATEIDKEVYSLAQNTSYLIRLVAEDADGDIVLSSANILFSTKYETLDRVTNLTAVSSDPMTADLYQITCATNPNAQITNVGYRVFILINGKLIKYRDNFITLPVQNRQISLKALLNKFDLKTNDSIQFGILPFYKLNGKTLFKTHWLSCSKPIYITPKNIFMLNKLLVSVENELKYALMYLNAEK